MKRSPLVAIILATIILAVVTVVAFAQMDGQETEPPAPAASTEPRPEGAPYEAWMTAETFLAAWQSTDPDVREAGFRATAIPDLADGLMMTAPEYIVTDQRQSIEVVGGSAYAAGFAVEYVDHPTVLVTLVAGPAGEYGWQVTDVALKK